MPRKLRFLRCLRNALQPTLRGAKRARWILWFTDILTWMMMIVSFDHDDRRFDRNETNGAVGRFVQIVLNDRGRSMPSA
jgi:hypothetical protein